MCAEDGDSVGTFAYKKGYKITNDSYAFSNAIRLIVFLNTGKLVKLYQMYFVSSKGQYDPFHTIINKFYFVFEEFYCFLSCLHEFEMCYGRVFNK